MLIGMFSVLIFPILFEDDNDKKPMQMQHTIKDLALWVNDMES
jgi:hypothetical protein